MADASSAVRVQAENAVDRDPRDASGMLRLLDSKQRRVLELFRDHAFVTAAEAAEYLGISRPTASRFCRQWTDEGFLEIHNPSRKQRIYRLADRYEKLIASGS